jgi:hypothetical protein
MINLDRAKSRSSFLSNEFLNSLLECNDKDLKNNIFCSSGSTDYTASCSNSHSTSRQQTRIIEEDVILSMERFTDSISKQIQISATMKPSKRSVFSVDRSDMVDNVIRGILDNTRSGNTNIDVRDRDFNVTTDMNDPKDRNSYKCDGISSNIVLNGTSNWLQQLDLMTLEPQRDRNFSICKEVLDPFELIHIASLLSSLSYPSSPSYKVPPTTATLSPKSSSRSGYLSRRNKERYTTSQKNLNQRIDEYAEGCKNTKDKYPATVVDDRKDLEIDIIHDSPTILVQLESIVHEIILQYSHCAYDAILMLRDMHYKNSTYNDANVCSKYNDGDDFEDVNFWKVCMNVVQPLSLGAICSGTDRVSIHSRMAIQDSLLKLLLANDDVVTAADLLHQWGRVTDIKSLSERVWESVRFLLGEQEQEEVYHLESQDGISPILSTSAPGSTVNTEKTWRTVETVRRRPLPIHEKLFDMVRLENKNQENDEIEQREKYRKEDEGVSRLIREEAGEGNDASSEEDRSDQSLSLPFNSDRLLRVRLIQATMLQKTYIDKFSTD